jgi:amino acid adenylation domain-containing protein/non-ribosomal peptide synthase protein (TIGR01720 family)
VLRTDLSGDPTFRELLARVRETCLGAYAHQDVPFEKLVDELAPGRDLARPPLFQAMFVLQNAPGGDLQLPGLTLSDFPVDAPDAKFDLTLSVAEGPDGLWGSIEYSTDLFEAATIGRLLGHFETLLEGIVDDPDSPLSRIPLLTDAERHHLLVTCNATESGYPRGTCVHRLFEEQAARTPGNVAIVFGDERMTYRELNARANQLAHHLQSLGVGPDTLVGVCLERTPDAVVAMLAALKAGGAYLPLDPGYPRERLAFMLEDAQATVLLTQERLLPNLPSAPHTRIVCVDRERQAVRREPTGNPEAGTTSGNLAYVIYTSGSTGRPKGVMVEHEGLANFATAFIQIMGAGPQSRVLQFASLSFDASVAEIVLALLSGAKLCLLGETGTSAGVDLQQQLRDLGITIAVLPPSVLRLLDPEGLPRIATMMSAGEACPPEVANRWAAGRRLLNGYGPTESTIGATWAACEGASCAAPPIGRPFPNIRVYVLDANRNPVPVGVPGELYIGGVGLARGYLNRPDLTAERYVPDPFGTVPGGRIYRTGDLVRWRPDGQLEHLGRLDHQVKIRGFRIELGEVEAALARHPAIGAALVTAWDDGPGAAPDANGEPAGSGGRRLVAYVVAKGTPAPTTSQLREFLKRELPEHMVPAAFVPLDAFPLTPNGKVDRKALPAPDSARPELERAYVAPRTIAETALARVWSQVLKVEPIGVHDNFFELGGDSILSIQVIARANQGGLTLTAKQLFQHPTIAELAALAATGPSGAAEQGAVVGAAALTPIQHWFFEQDLPARSHFNQSILLEAPSDVDPALLGQAFARVLEHHDALRLRFRCGADGAWGQEFAPPEGQAPFAVIDLSATPEQEQPLSMQAEADRIQASLDIEQGPLTRLALFDLGPGRARPLLWVAHHLAVDGVSWRILPQDLETAYLQLAQAKPVVLPPKTTSFKQWSERLSQHALSARLDGERGHWLPEPRKDPRPIPVDLPGGACTPESARHVLVAFTPEETRALLQEVPKAYRTQINDALLAALAQAVCAWTKDSRVLIDLEGHGREELFDGVDVSRTVGWFTTMFPVLLELPDTRDAGACLGAVKEQLRAVPERGIGYGLLRYLKDAPTARIMGQRPAAAIAFNYLGQFDPGATESGLFRGLAGPRGRDQSASGTMSHPLSVNGAVTDGRLGLVFTYSGNLHRHDTVEALADGFAAALRALIAHCCAPETAGYTPSDFPLAKLEAAKLEHILRKQVKAR